MEVDYMPIATTATREFECDLAVTIPFPEILFIRVLGCTLIDVVSVFSNPAETETIFYNGQRFDGYSHFMAVTIEGDAIKVTLGR